MKESDIDNSIEVEWEILEQRYLSQYTSKELMFSDDFPTEIWLIYSDLIVTSLEWYIYNIQIIIYIYNDIYIVFQVSELL